MKITNKIKWYECINPLFWLEHMVSQAIYQKTQEIAKNVSQEFEEKYLK